ncbi:hypothetical protein KIW84_072733 [Lathyrus oleraceus]|uniref:Uncharacterized protein n=1 Tax=Pisum sativum TaxID=3888 RepID=A0A9D4ZXP6_PEA|nr:hypothetical protein KIW84_072733 [Pisum sativum]
MCESGHSTGTEIFRYKIEIEVTHSGKCCKFVFWYRECLHLLGISATQMRDTMIKVGITDLLEFPLALDVMLGLEISFKVKCKSRWVNCSFVMILQYDTFLKQLKSPWEHSQATTSHPPTASQLLQIRESVDEPRFDVVEECEVVMVSI